MYLYIYTYNFKNSINPQIIIILYDESVRVENKFQLPMCFI